MSADPFSHAPPAGPFSTDSGARPGPAPAFPSDEQVLRDMAAGHEGALLELHRRYARALYGLGGRILASPEAIQQGVEDALMTAWHHAAHYEPARASVHGWLISIAHHRFLQLRRGAGGTLRLHDQFGRLDTPGDQDLHLLALAYYCGEPPARLAEISGLPQPAVEEALLSAISRLPGLAQEALAKAAVPAPAPPAEPTAEAAEDDLFPTLSSLAATAPVTRVEPWEPPRRPEQREPETEAEAVLPEASEATLPVSEPLPNAEPEATQPAEQSPETTAPEVQA
ncbi:sigma-70 family RNA polymerase sigma factor [Deinococcus radiodurans]|jgi:RNA polymerase sigma factor, sigma-70 family|uniref:Sigma factor, putative n=1 Tax=Deinococcus radiodurans (strain ATCC 13939 / DSM 20539 / JCM 16871 / CCUG 27074 / LMG 4051 / NBRC 15346 / NCIMB 9279 / VKM B-1422 / R1) TaxID=243230 RepID=Q9RW65_DEIRA|nr:sigma-70 family RNA polymerase sigma factor [Deinococcus radiodurans]AAF10382.1 sigma factor, putative [Deinococcus radiodurans R1 = ATCC 13939 = DSM 20539]ANC71982.1 RNA polymerase subunit sigma [Deinococcus radiodurans R1 = ATCC 13939 = DSM 20539]QEM70315.1 sigma-70 family RNA polymerase sigma factor [Deinococcus radiodurans]UDK99967.1 sigma-70 family RNA polymerase sigma factor [Deinococcus radiodurans R1 = ATCC 13939 = DSM 20539]UID69800.1 RNA polymerase subunit sigma [Deinococcus radio